jgi:hypothetical protein
VQIVLRGDKSNEQIGSQVNPREKWNWVKRISRKVVSNGWVIIANCVFFGLFLRELNLVEKTSFGEF